jgi:hypothetical protein
MMEEDLKEMCRRAGSLDKASFSAESDAQIKDRPLWKTSTAF